MQPVMPQVSQAQPSGKPHRPSLGGPPLSKKIKGDLAQSRHIPPPRSAPRRIGQETAAHPATLPAGCVALDNRHVAEQDILLRAQTETLPPPGSEITLGQHIRSMRLRLMMKPSPRSSAQILLAVARTTGSQEPAGESVAPCGHMSCTSNVSPVPERGSGYIVVSESLFNSHSAACTL